MKLTFKINLAQWLSHLTSPPRNILSFTQRTVLTRQFWPLLMCFFVTTKETFMKKRGWAVFLNKLWLSIELLAFRVTNFCPVILIGIDVRGLCLMKCGAHEIHQNFWNVKIHVVIFFRISIFCGFFYLMNDILPMSRYFNFYIPKI